MSDKTVLSIAALTALTDEIFRNAGVSAAQSAAVRTSWPLRRNSAARPSRMPGSSSTSRSLGVRACTPVVVVSSGLVSMGTPDHQRTSVDLTSPYRHLVTTINASRVLHSLADRLEGVRSTHRRCLEQPEPERPSPRRFE
mgnify:CR=1 FL=1